MSDKYTYKEEFVNESWGKMSALLDQEMPVKRKRILPLWILLLIMLFISGISVAFIYSSDKKDEEINIPKIPVADLNQETINKEELIIPNNNFVVNNKKDSNTENIAFVSSKKSEHNIPVNKNTKSHLIQENSINNEVDNIQALNPLISDTKDIIGINNSIENNIIIPELSNNSYASLEEIKSEKDDLIITSEIEDKPLASIDNIISKKKKWKFGFGTGIKLKSGKEKGFFVSADAQREISPKWNINTGAEYFNMKTSAYYNPNSGKFFIPEENFNPISSIAPLAESHVGTKIRYHGFKVPILASYEMSPNWEIQMGIVTQLLFNNLKNKYDRNDSPTLDELNSLDKQLSKTKLLNFDPQVALGIAYHPTNNITAEIRYEQGVRNRVNDNEYFHASSRYNTRFSGLHVGMKYYF